MMNVGEAAEKLGAEFVVRADAEREVAGFYAGDLLSHCMGKIGTDSLWFTVMNHVNVAAVAALCEASAIVVCEGIVPDATLTEKCRAEGINLLVCSLDIFHCCACVA